MAFLHCGEDSEEHKASLVEKTALEYKASLVEKTPLEYRAILVVKAPMGTRTPSMEKILHVKFKTSIS